MLVVLGWMDRDLRWGSAKISQPPYESIESRPSTSLKKARSASALWLKIITCPPETRGFTGFSLSSAPRGGESDYFFFLFFLACALLIAAARLFGIPFFFSPS